MRQSRRIIVNIYRIQTMYDSTMVHNFFWGWSLVRKVLVYFCYVVDRMFAQLESLENSRIWADWKNQEKVKEFWKKLKKSRKSWIHKNHRKISKSIFSGVLFSSFFFIRRKKCSFWFWKFVKISSGKPVKVKENYLFWKVDTPW